MKKVLLPLAALGLCFTACKKEETKVVTTKTDTIVVTETDTTTPGQPLDSAEVNRAWMAYMTPGEMHKMLADETGKWDVTMTFWEKPGATPQTDHSTAEAKMIMGGRYQEFTFTGKMMGMDWEGKSTTAYNNKSGMFTTTFIDNSGTGMMVASGTYDEATKSVTYNGESVDPVTGKTVKYREVYTFTDATTRKMEMYDKKPGMEEYKSLELLFKKK